MREASTRGTSRFGRYALGRPISQGGMATVYAGHLVGAELGFSRLVAIKRPLASLAEDPELSAMFLDEARLAAKIRHPNVVATLDVGTVDGELFVVMDYVEGQTLSALLREVSKRGERIPYRICAGILCDVLRGLAAAHDARDEHGTHLSLVHRDVSPQNIMVGLDGVTRVLDFGIAKAFGRHQPTTREGAVKGKIGYMAPEQLRGEALTPRADLYAASVVLWELLTSRRLFSGDSEAIVVARVVSHAIEPVRAHAAEVPEALAAIVERGLSSDPAARFPDARAMCEALEQCVGAVSVNEIAAWVESIAGETIRARSADLGRSAEDAISSVTMVTPATPLSPRERVRRTRVIAAAALGVLVASAAVTTALMHRAEPIAAPAVAASLGPAPAPPPAPSADAPPVVSAPLPSATPSAPVNAPKRIRPHAKPAATPKPTSTFDRIGGRQ